MTVTADDIRALARARGQDHVLALTNGEVQVVTATEAKCDGEACQVLYTQAELLEEFGEEVTDAEAEVLAGALTAKIASR